MPVSYYGYLTKNQTEQLKQVSVKYNAAINSIKIKAIGKRLPSLLFLCWR